MKAYTAKAKDGFETALENVIEFLNEQGHKVKSFIPDSQQIMKWGQVRQLLDKKGIQPQYSLYAHYQNLLQRYVQAIMKAVSTVLHDRY
jgi:D-mannonate dehydratase